MFHVPFHRMLLQDTLQQNKEVKQKKGRDENQEAGDATQHKGTMSLNLSTRQAQLEQEEDVQKGNPRKERGSSSNRCTQMKSTPRNEKTEILSNPCKWGRGGQMQLITQGNKEMNFIIPLDSNINSIYKPKAVITLLLLLLLSRFSRVRLGATPETAARQGPPSLGFSRQEYWSGLPFPPPMHESEK